MSGPPQGLYGAGTPAASPGGSYGGSLGGSMASSSLGGGGSMAPGQNPWQMQPTMGYGQNGAHPTTSPVGQPGTSDPNGFGQSTGQPNPFGGQGMNYGGTTNPVGQPGQSDIIQGRPPGPMPTFGQPAPATNPNVNAGNASAWAALQNLRSRGFAG
jgi:hypothetical protein